MSEPATDLFDTLVEELIRRETTNQLAAYTPYPFQKAWHNARGKDTQEPARQKALMAANQVGKCITIRSAVDTIEGEAPLSLLWGTSCYLMDQDGSPRQVKAWVRKPAGPCYRITFADGRWLECSPEHYVLTDVGMSPISQIFASLPKSVFRAQNFPESVRRGVRRFWGRVRGWTERCFACFRPCGERLLRAPGGVQVFAPLEVDAPRRILLWYSLGDLADRCTNTLSQVFARLSSWYAVARFSGPSDVYVTPYVEPFGQLRSLSSRIRRRFSSSERLGRKARRAAPDQFSASAFKVIPVSDNKIVAVDYIGVHNLYDLQVEGGVYTAAGLTHHNTWCGAFEVAIHATGLYPDWWKGHRFPHAVNILVAGVSFDRVRDTLQEKLFGDPHDDSKFGTGTIPLDLIVGKPVRKQGYQDTIDSCGVRHVSGGVSRVRCQAYEQGFKKFMATGFHVVELDEEPPLDIYSQCLRSVTSTRGIINLTFTPEEGVTQVVDGFMNELKEGQAFISATWDDAPHISENPTHREQLLSALPAHEREMRSKGIPRLGSGAIYPVQDDTITVQPFDIPLWWPRIAALDFGGFEHPFAAVWLALDRDTDTAYVYKTYKGMGSMPLHADALKRQGCDWIPTAWPHDVGQADKRSGIALADVLRDEYGLNMLYKVFSNPPAPGQEEGQGGQGVEIGLSNILTAMETGRFKVFATEREWFREKSLYHRKASRDGPVRIVKRMDDLMDATRYAYQSQRFADVKPRVTTARPKVYKGMRNW